VILNSAACGVLPDAVNLLGDCYSHSSRSARLSFQPGARRESILSSRYRANKALERLMVTLSLVHQE
jgi:hypothetical protein